MTGCALGLRAPGRPGRRARRRSPGSRRAPRPGGRGRGCRSCRCRPRRSSASTSVPRVTSVSDGGALLVGQARVAVQDTISRDARRRWGRRRGRARSRARGRGTRWPAALGSSSGGCPRRAAGPTRRATSSPEWVTAPRSTVSGSSSSRVASCSTSSIVAPAVASLGQLPQCVEAGERRLVVGQTGRTQELAIDAVELQRSAGPVEHRVQRRRVEPDAAASVATARASVRSGSAGALRSRVVSAAICAALPLE